MPQLKIHILKTQAAEDLVAQPYRSFNEKVKCEQGFLSDPLVNGVKYWVHSHKHVPQVKKLSLKSS